MSDINRGNCGKMLSPEYDMSRSKGQKRPFGKNCPSHPNAECACESVSPDEVDLPLSKRICQLHIGTSSHSEFEQRILGVSRDQGQLSQQDLQYQDELMGAPSETTVDSQSLEAFTRLYPYEIDSPYFAINKLLNTLYFERTNRSQQRTNE